LTCMRSMKYGGIEHYIVETSRQCNNLGYKTVVQYEEYPKSSIYCRDLRNLGVDVIILRSDLNMWQSARQITKLIHTIRPMIVQTYFPSGFTRLIIPLVAKILRVRKSFAIVLSMYHYSRKSIKSRIAKFSYNNYDKVICISNAIAENLCYAGINKKKISTLYLGIFGHVKYSEKLREHFRKELEIPANDIVFSCIAFDTAFKGLDILLRAFKKASDDRSDVDLIIIGVDPSQSQLPTLAKDLGISEHIRWAGIRDEGWQVLNAADIYVQSSRFSEGLSLATIEAMALKLPVVATRVAGPGEIVLDEETGYLCRPNDIDELAKVMRRILHQPERWTEMGRAGYQRYIEMLQGEKSVKTLIQNYYLM
jgi:glycosyltransferase involved in cell wall biosynthesis